MKLEEVGCCSICENALEPLSVVVTTEIDGLEQSTYGVCHSCNFAQATKIPSENTLKNYYSKNSQLRRESLTTQEAFHIEKQIAFLLKYIGKSTVTLEYGPDMGHFLQQLKNRRQSDSFYFSEYSPQASAHLEELGFHQFDGGAVDTIIARHVFEHIPHPVKWLANLNSILSDEGVLFIEVPDYTVLDSQNCDPFQFEHLSYFTLNSLQQAANRSGFFIQAVERDQTPGYSVSSGYVIRAILKKLTTTANLASWNSLSNEQECKFECFSKLIKHTKSEGKTVAIYGAGTLSRQLSIDPTLAGCVSIIYDIDIKKIGTNLFGTEVKDANRISNGDFDVIFVTVLGYKDEVTSFLKAHNIVESSIRYLY